MAETSTAPLTVSCLCASLIAGLGAMTAGTILAYPSPAISDIDNNRNPYHLTNTQQTWFGSVVFLGSFVGTFVSGLLMDRAGRKFVLMLMAFPTIIGWQIIVSSQSPTTALVGRAVTGFGRGVLMPTVHVYIAEIAPAHMRGTLLALSSLSNVLGNLYEYLLGSFIHWNWLAVANMIVPLLMCVLLCAVPETPRFLVQSGRTEEAEQILLKLRDDSECIAGELKEIEDSVRRNNVKFHCTRDGSFFAPPLLKPLLISIGIFSVRELSGSNSIRTYAVSIIAQTGMPSSEANTLSIVMGLVGVGGVLMSCVVIDRLGRRTLLMTSCLSMALCLTSFGVYLKLLEVNESYVINHLYWLGPISLVLNNLSFSLAFDTIPDLIINEMFATRVRGKANSVVKCWQSVVAFMVTFFLFSMERRSDVFISFFFCGMVCVVGAVLLFFIVPETKHKTLENIQSKFQMQSKGVQLDIDYASTHI